MRIIPRGELGATLKAARQKTKHTQYSLAEQLQVKQPTISAWENGEHEPPRERWGDIAKALESSIEELFFYSTNEESESDAEGTQGDAA